MRYVLADFWVCATCRSINRPKASRCYSCRRLRDAEPDPVVPAPTLPPAQPPVPPERLAPPVVPAPRPAAQAVPAPAPAPSAAPSPSAAPEPAIQPAPAPPPRERWRIASAKPTPADAPAREAAPGAGASSRLVPRPVPGDAVPASGPHHRGRLLGRVAVGGVVVAAVVVLVAGGWLLATRDAGAPKEDLHTVAGRLDLVQGHPGQVPSFASNDGTSCFGVGTFHDVRLGMPVSFESPDGTLLGQGWLDDGEIAPAAGRTPPTCSFRFRAGVRPATAYRIIPGTRAALDRSADELSASGWTVVITLKP